MKNYTGTEWEELYIHVQNLFLIAMDPTTKEYNYDDCPEEEFKAKSIVKMYPA